MPRRVAQAARRLVRRPAEVGEKFNGGPRDRSRLYRSRDGDTLNFTVSSPPERSSRRQADETIDESFPASDPPANTVETGVRVGEVPGSVGSDRFEPPRAQPARVDDRRLDGLPGLSANPRDLHDSPHGSPAGGSGDTSASNSSKPPCASESPWVCASSSCARSRGRICDGAGLIPASPNHPVRV